MAQIDRRTPWLNPQPADGIGPVAEYYTNRYPSLPVFIIETRMPTDNGAPRPDGLTRSQQLLNAVDSIRRARQRGIPSSGRWTGVSPTTTNGSSSSGLSCHGALLQQMRRRGALMRAPLLVEIVGQRPLPKVGATEPTVACCWVSTTQSW